MDLDDSKLTYVVLDKWDVSRRITLMQRTSQQGGIFWFRRRGFTGRGGYVEPPPSHTRDLTILISEFAP